MVLWRWDMVVGIRGGVVRYGGAGCGVWYGGVEVRWGCGDVVVCVMLMWDMIVGGMVVLGIVMWWCGLVVRGILMWAYAGVGYAGVGCSDMWDIVA